MNCISQESEYKNQTPDHGQSTRNLFLARHLRILFAVGPVDQNAWQSHQAWEHAYFFVYNPARTPDIHVSER